MGGRAILGGGIGPKKSFGVNTPVLGGGVAGEEGSHKTNSFYLGIEALGTIHFNRAGAVTLWIAMDVHSDRWGRAADNRRMLHVAVGDESRQNLVRGRIGGILELTVSKRMNFWGMFEGALGDPRRVYGNVFLSSSKGRTDPQIYGMAGITLKFGSLWDEEDLE